MKKIGMLVAVEMDAVLRRYGTAERREKRSGFEIHVYDMGAYELYAIRSGAGEISAAAATQMLIDRFEVELVVNFGVVGGLTEEMAQTKTCVVERVVHYDYDTTAYDHCLLGQYMGYPDEYLRPTPALVERATAICPELKRVTDASADKFIEGREAKSALHERWGADICEMEAAAVGQKGVNSKKIFPERVFSPFFYTREGFFAQIRSIIYFRTGVRLNSDDRTNPPAFPLFSAVPDKNACLGTAHGLRH